MVEPVSMDYVYRNAPLTEVIVEVRWKTVPLASVPGGAVDPFFSEVEPAFRSKLREMGFGHSERLVSEDFPLELMPAQVAWRLRRSPGSWPLYQLGPGVMTVNALPPYYGWSKFRGLVDAGFEKIRESHTDVGGRLAIDRLALRYINVFTEKLGFSNHAEFLSQQLGISIDVKAEVENSIGDLWPKRLIVGELSVPLNEPAESDLIIKINRGLVDGKESCVVELIATSTKIGSTDCMVWFDAARAAIHRTFSAMLSDDLKEKIGPREVVK